MNLENLALLIQFYIYVNLSIVAISIIWFLVRNIRNGNFKRLFKSKTNYRFKNIHERIDSLYDDVTTNQNEVFLCQKDIDLLKAQYDELIMEKLKSKRHAPRNKKQRN